MLTQTRASVPAPLSLEQGAVAVPAGRTGKPAKLRVEHLCCWAMPHRLGAPLSLGGGTWCSALLHTSGLELGPELLQLTIYLLLLAICRPSGPNLRASGEGTIPENITSKVIPMIFAWTR